MKKLRRVFAAITVVVMLFALASTAMASRLEHTNREIRGGPSQSVMVASRDRSINIEARVDSWIRRSQSNWRMRGYYGANACTELSPEIVRTGNWLADFISYPDAVNIKMSIASTNYSDYLIWSGITYC